jgi:hypothetical protein
MQSAPPSGHRWRLAGHPRRVRAWQRGLDRAHFSKSNTEAGIFRRKHMYRTKSGEEIFIIDGHTHNWNAAKDNIKNIHGQQFIDCFYGYHSVLSPKDQIWPKEKFDHYGPEQMR